MIIPERNIEFFEPVTLKIISPSNTTTKVDINSTDNSFKNRFYEEEDKKLKILINENLTRQKLLQEVYILGYSFIQH